MRNKTLTLSEFKKQLLKIGATINNSINYSNTRARLEGLPMDPLTHMEHQQMVNNMRNAVSDGLNNIKRHNSRLTEEELKAVRTRLLLKAVAIYSAANCEEFVLIGYQQVSEMFKELIGSHKLNFDIMHIKYLHSKIINHVIISVDYKNHLFFWDVQHQFITEQKSDLKSFDRGRDRHNYLLEFDEEKYELEPVTRDYCFKTPNYLEECISKEEKKIKSDYQRWRNRIEEVQHLHDNEAYRKMQSESEEQVSVLQHRPDFEISCSKILQELDNYRRKKSSSVRCCVCFGLSALSYLLIPDIVGVVERLIQENKVREFVLDFQKHGKQLQHLDKRTMSIRKIQNSAKSGIISKRSEMYQICESVIHLVETYNEHDTDKKHTLSL